MFTSDGTFIFLYLVFAGKVAKVGATPGVTRAIQTKIRVNDDPLVYLVKAGILPFPNLSHLFLEIYLRDDLFRKLRKIIYLYPS